MLSRRREGRTGRKNNSPIYSRVFFTLVFALIILFPVYSKTSLKHDSPSVVGSPSLVSKGEISEGFISIQQAINDAENGSTILVPSGVYHERIVINKTLSLIGENVSTTIIDGSNAGTVVTIVADNVTIAGFTVRYSGWGWTNNGIYVHFADRCEIRDNYLFVNCHNIRLNYSRESRVEGNVIDGNGYGIRLLHSENCAAIGNSVSNCIGGVHLEYATNCTVAKNNLTRNSQGIRLYSPCTYNRIYENTVRNNTYDGMIEAMPGNTTILGNTIFHNNFVDNKYPFIYNLQGTTWDDGYPSGGNYWSRYNGTDVRKGLFQNETGSDGIGDVQYAVNVFDRDRYPLMHSYGSVHNINTDLTYLTIQAAIDAPETLNGHTIFVKSGIYKEHIVLRSTLSIVGENRTTTIIDGEHTGTVFYVQASTVVVTGFTIQNSGSNSPPYGDDCGIFLDHCVGANISHSLIVNNRIGLYLYLSEESKIEHNIAWSNYEGIWLWRSSNNVLIGNEIHSNEYNFGVFGNAFPDFNNSVDESNTVDGKPICYRIGLENRTIDNSEEVGVLYLVNCHNITVRNLNVTKNGHGIHFYNVTGSRVENVTAIENNYGICLQSSEQNVVSYSYCRSNWVGICVQDSRNNLFESNRIEWGEKGFSLVESSNNTLEGNSVLHTLYGIRVSSSNFNRVFHNNFVQNDEQVDLLFSYQNSWDNGFEGNYWSTYNGSDLNNDGLGDFPEEIDDANTDLYPLLGVFSKTRVQLDGNTYCVEVISNSSLLSLVYERDSMTISLGTHGPDGTYGYCRICIPHSLIEPDINVIIDNGSTEVLHANYTVRDDGLRRWIYFTYRQSAHEIVIKNRRTSDVNNDGKVDLIDVYILGKAFGSHSGDRRWNLLCDVNKDGKIDLLDCYVFWRNYGK